jgi:thymidine phosphorylase
VGCFLLCGRVGVGRCADVRSVDSGRHFVAHLMSLATSFGDDVSCVLSKCDIMNIFPDIGQGLTVLETLNSHHTHPHMRDGRMESADRVCRG